MDQKQGLDTNYAGMLSDQIKEAWKNFMDQFQQVFDLEQLDPVLSLLKELDSSRRNSNKKKRTEVKEKGQVSSDTTTTSTTTNNNNDALSSLEKKVFGNHLLAKSVFKCLSISHLLPCRLMSSYWNESATEILLTKENTGMQFIRRPNTNRYFQQISKNVSNWRTLDMFTELLRTCKKFPCNKFEFYGGNLGNDDAQRFFTFYGKSIKSIKIVLKDENLLQDKDKSEDGFSVSLTESRIIGMILSHHLPNLEALDLNLTHEEEEDEEEEGEEGEGNDWRGYESLLFPAEKPILLPNLKKLTYYSMHPADKPFLSQLVKAAVNLKEFHAPDKNFNMKYLEIFIETGKVKCIMGGTFDVINSLEQLEKMVEHKPELECLKLGVFGILYKEPQKWTRISTLLSKFLESSQKSLNSLPSFYCLGFLPQLQLPVLENITYLFLDVMSQSTFNSQDVHDYSFSFLPRGATFSRNFPQLNSVSIWLGSIMIPSEYAARWSQCFPTDEIIPTLKRLSICGCGYCPELWMKGFSRVFPNVKSLSADSIKDFSIYTQAIWSNFNQLTFLTLELDMTSPLNSRPFILDSSFTGIPVEGCKTLANFSLSKLEQVGENFVERPSICNLKALQILTISFKNNYPVNKEYDFSSTLTHVTGVCAFKRMDSLKRVYIEVQGLKGKQNVPSKIDESLQPLTPYKVIIK